MSNIGFPNPATSLAHLSGELHEPVHVGLEAGEVLRHGVQVQVVDDHQVT